MSENKINIHIGNRTLTATLAANSSAEALKATAPPHPEIQIQYRMRRPLRNLIDASRPP